jgi:hypothetical protein
MRDFTIQTYKKLLVALQKKGFEFLQYRDFQKNNVSQKRIVLRNDVDAGKENSLQFAKIQNQMSIVSTYYFRIVPQCFDEKLIKEIAGFGHEIGYHYETMDTVSKRIKNESRKINVKNYDLLIDAAYEEFCRNLELFRKLIPVETICMHGSPLSKYDNRAIWVKYDYKNLGIIAEPYFDVDYDDVLYLTDTGRRWDGDAVSIRDKIGSDEKKNQGGKGGGERKGEEHLIPQTYFLTPFPCFHSTFDIIKAAEEGLLPDKIMMTFHPQRWTDRWIPWLKELMWQNIKNIGKYFLIKVKNH